MRLLYKSVTRKIRRAFPGKERGNFETINERNAKGDQYWDPNNKMINYVLKNEFASGKDLLVGRNIVTGDITTVLRGTNLVKPRFVPVKFN